MFKKLLKFSGIGLVYNFSESFVGNVFIDKVKPKKGSVVYCDLAFGYAEHSGIYVGNNKIVHLNSRGNIEIVSASEFIEGTTALSIYVSSSNGKSDGSEPVCRRALRMVGKCRDYNVILDNCHQFTSGCLTGNFENSDNFLWMLKDTTEKILGSDEWRVWER
ncbi:lecithin retinol acyltransferase family protein [Ursidibacter maritimus]|uniref:Lecithin retinol acyltransferase family protein n=1 Tax=Ursidibacter maritimus TaxID=1331689 RepID=A0A949WFC3_9PAST|nr:lecithin retinol acyltransferase family protein [Ursidibacter maritimus]KAE9539257.1 hypothetical protein A1D26_04345 [Ursidibacter maritimus]MBV6525769.1 lecithin retinol acyltransferase family protein [Ursidibacter maritimus]MBV6526881.1 lecithin retinol acyltransferase family protein [Ursidibacter maritimus]MBV6529829.1 lecithin retinol acyltransferase family protein [Ursidibacter maritimus]MBV6531277.1 lecithin retinol acyltransferase family protein [Ursidibacter maritimus]